MTVGKGFDVDNDLLAHIDAALNRCRTHVRQGNDAVRREQTRIDCRLVLEDVEAGAGDGTRFQEPDKLIFVDDLTACGVHEIGGRLQELQPPRRKKVIGRRRMRAVDRDDVHPRQHLIEAFPVGGLQLFLDLFLDTTAVVIVNLQAERFCAPGDCLANAAHADDAETFAINAMSEHPRRRPSRPVRRGIAHVGGALREAAGNGKNERHRHVGRVFGQDAGRVRDQDAAVARGIEIDVIDAGAEVRDQTQAGTGLGQDGAVDTVGDGRNEDVGRLHGFDQLGLAHRFVVDVQTRLEQLTHPRLDDIGEFPCDNDDRLLGGRRHSLSVA